MDLSRAVYSRGLKIITKRALDAMIRIIVALGRSAGRRRLRFQYVPLDVVCV